MNNFHHPIFNQNIFKTPCKVYDITNEETDYETSFGKKIDPFLDPKFRYAKMSEKIDQKQAKFKEMYKQKVMRSMSNYKDL